MTTGAALPRPIPSRPFATPARPGSRPRPEPIPPDLREALWTRSGGLCELCGAQLQPDWQAHHRKLRSRGGLNSVSNLIALHPLCHRRAHSHVAWAEETGFIVASHADPAYTKMALHGESWVLLRTDGTYGGHR